MDISSNVNPFVLADGKKTATVLHEVKEIGAGTMFLLRVVYLPFNSHWQWVIQFCILASISTDVYFFYFDNKVEQNMWIHYIIEITYLIDTVLAYIHRYRKDIRKFSTHTPRSLIILAIDTLSLIPIYEFYFIALPHLTSAKFIIYVRMKNGLRIFHLIAFLFYKRYTTTKVHIATILMTHFLVLIFFNLIFSLLWAMQGSCYPNCPEPNWSSSLIYYDINTEGKGFDWFVVCFTTMGNVLIHCWSGFIMDHHIKDAFIIIGVLIVGLISHQWIELAHLISCFVQLQQRRFEYLRLLRRLDFVFNWGASKESRKRILRYYNLLWRKQSGIFYRPHFINSLPISLLHETLIDIYWESLRHSHVFRNVDMSLKKGICTNMKTEYFLAGDYLIRVGSQTYKMIYIVSGIIHILSKEDDTTAILSLSGGTVLGEVNLAMLQRANVNVKCATACEIKSLDIMSFARSLILYNQDELNIHRIMKERISKAKFYKEMKAKLANQGSVSAVLKRNDHIKKLKAQWRNIHKLHEMALQNKIVGPKSLRTLEKSYYSANLDMLVLQNKEYIDHQTICETSKWPYVLNPNSDFRHFLKYLHLVAVSIYTVALPYLLAFRQDIDFNYYLVMLIVDLFYLFDIYVQAITYVKEGDLEIRQAKKIFLYRLNQITFLIDLITAIPYDYVGLFTELTTYRLMTLKLPKLVQWYKIMQLVIEKQQAVIKYAITIIMVKYAIIYTTLFYYTISVQYYFFNFGQHGRDASIHESSPLVNAPVLNCIVYSTSIITQTGMSERTPINVPEMITYCVLSFVASYVHYFVICELLSNIVKRNEEKYNHFKRLKAVHNFLIGKSLVTKFLNYAHKYSSFHWDYNKSIIIDTRKSQETPEYKLIVKKVVDTLKRVPVFKHYSDELLTRLAQYADIRVLPPNSIMCEAGKRCLYLHIITKGYCQMDCFMPGDAERNTIAILAPGDCFPILESLHYVNCLNTVYSSTTLEEISISVVNIFNALQCNLFETRTLKETLKWHKEKYNSIFMELCSDFHADTTGSRQPKPKLQLDFTNFFQYEVIERDIEKEQQVRKERHKLGAFRFIFFKKSLNPNGKFYASWEVFRSLIVVLYFFMLTGVDTFLKHRIFASFIFYSSIVTLIIFIFDIYIRFYVQFYNEENIKITSVVKTCKNYLKSSFVCDVICAIPYNFISALPIHIDNKYSTNLNLPLIVIIYACILYRPLQGLLYMEKNLKGIKQYIASILFYSLVGYTLFMLIANNMFLTVCHYNNNRQVFDCNRGQHFITTSPFKEENRTWVLMLYSLYAVSERITTDFVGVSEYQLTTDAFNSLVLVIAAWVCKTVIVCLIMSASITGNSIMLNKARTRFFNFNAFVKHERVTQRCIDDVKEHFEYVTAKTDGNDMMKLLKPFHDKFRLDIKRSLFQPALIRTRLLGGLSQETLQIFYDYFDIKYYKINAEIVRCNDIHNTLYVVSKGTVDISVAGFTMCHLETGGVFGSLSATGPIRQTITARAMVHVELLAINSHLFQQFIKPYPWVYEMLTKARAYGIEFFAPVEINVHLIDDGSIPSRNITSRLRRQLVLKKVGKIIRSNNIYFKGYAYAVVHISPISSIILVMFMFRFQITYIYIYCVLCDAFFWMYIIINFNLEYTDPELGVQVKDPKLIRRRYAKSLLFWVTFLGTLPIEAIPFAAGASEFVIKICLLNRLLRFVHILKYYHDAKKNLTFNTLLQWFYMIYLLAFQISIMSLLWYVVACPNGICASRVSEGPSKKMGYAPARYDIVLCFLYIIILFTSSGLRSVSATNIGEILATSFISLASVLTTSLMTGIFASLIIIKSLTINTYKDRVYKLQRYMASHRLSPFLQRKIASYITALWFRRRGELIPELIPDAPTYLQQDIMYSMYGDHLFNHDVFQYMHKDLMRQVCVLFKVGLYMPNQLVVEKGDVDGCMYFLHRGEMKVIDGDRKVIVGPGFSFGEEQGLYKVAHDRTYISYTTIDLLILEYSAWSYLLNHFPASKEVIFQEIQQRCKSIKRASSSVITRISNLSED